MSTKVTVASSQFKRSSDTCMIVGFALPSRDKTPWDDLSKDLIGLNEESVWDWFKRKPEDVTAFFQLHPRQSFIREDNQNDPEHWKWLRKKHPFPIFMQEKYDDVPSSIKYPWDKVVQEFGTYFTSSLTYIMAWAYLEGYTKMELYGFNMASNTEYIRQRANAHYFIGLMRGKGIDVYIPPECMLMRGYAEYAYDDVMLGARQDLEMLEKIHITKLEGHANEINRVRGTANALLDATRYYPELTDAYSEAEKLAVLKRDDFHLKKGWTRGLKSAEKLMDKYLGMDRNPDKEAINAKS